MTVNVSQRRKTLHEIINECDALSTKHESADDEYIAGWQNALATVSDYCMGLDRKMWTA